LASGVLPIALGEATKCVSFIQEKSKKYSFTIKWGESTETDDLEGEVIERSNIRPKKSEILKVLHSFTGEIFQRPPLYSAIKINGQRSYKLARKKIIFEHEFRQVTIYKLILNKILNDDYAQFEVICSKGTYIRSLASDIAHKLNTKGHVTALRRLSVGNFEEKDTIFIDFSKEIIHSPSILKNILPIEAVLDDIPALSLNDNEARKLTLGQKIQLNKLEFNDKLLKDYPNYSKFEKIYATNNNNLIALIKIEDDLVKPKRIINF